MRPTVFLRNFGLAVFALVVFGLASPAKADTFQIVGVDHPGDVLGTVQCSFNPATNTLTFTITNNSPHDARITGIGFDLPPIGNASPSGLNGFSGANVGAFTFSDAALGNVPHGFNSVVLDFGFVTGAQFNAGDPNAGIAPGNSLTFVVSGAAFAGFTEAQICHAIFVRFQRVGANGQESDVAVFCPNCETTNIPEPATMLLLGSGLLGVAGAVRRRVKK